MQSKTPAPDIVYLLRSDIVNTDELRYSMRTLDNLPHGKVWTAGGVPKGLKPDRALEIRQLGTTKWQRSTYALKQACKVKELSQEFYLFNDDFFILQPTDRIPAIYNGTLEDRIKSLGVSLYSTQLKQTAQELKHRGLTTYSYAVHIPMLIDKDKALEVLNVFDGYYMFRSLYGNYWQIGGEDMADVKIHKQHELPGEDARYVSTADMSFKYGEVGRYIRQTFSRPSRYEEV